MRIITAACPDCHKMTIEGEIETGNIQKVIYKCPCILLYDAPPSETVNEDLALYIVGCYRAVEGAML